MLLTLLMLSFFFIGEQHQRNWLLYLTALSAHAFLLVINGPSWDKYLHDDAAWAALSAGVPTVNGRYGHFPPDYPFRAPRIQGPEDRGEFRNTLETWVMYGGGDPVGAAMIEVAPRPQRHRPTEK